MIIPERGRSYIDPEVIAPVDRAIELALGGRQLLELARGDAEIIEDGISLIESGDSTRRTEVFNSMLLYLTADEAMSFEEVSLATAGSTHLEREARTLFNMAQLVVDGPYNDENHEFSIPE